MTKINIKSTKNKLLTALLFVGLTSYAHAGGLSSFMPIFGDPAIPKDPYPKCDNIPSYNKALDDGERIVYKAFFPNLNLQTAKETSFSTRCYNCIAWTLGITNDWLWPDAHAAATETSTTVQDFDDFYKKLGFVRTDKPAQADIALWGNKSPSGNIYATHASINKPATNQWESKLGAFIRMQHDKDDLVGDQYGMIVAYYKKDTNLAQHFQQKRQQLIAKRPQLTADEYAKIQRKVRNLPINTQKQFSMLYDTWKATWFAKPLSINSNPASRKNSQAYQDLLAMGQQILPLVASRMILPDNFFAIQLYDDLQKQSRLKVAYGSDFDVLEGEAGRSAYTLKKYAQSL